MGVSKQALILAIGFLLGAALMGVEMAAIRMMTPYFGSAIETWACMIATVMLSMMAGYFLGGVLADRAPRSAVLGGVVLAAGAYILAVPFFTSAMLDWMLQHLGYNPPAVLAASVALLFLPMMLLSFFSPFAVRLLLADAQHGGRVAGLVYSITTVGNVVGTLVAPLWLMRILGSRDIMLSFAAVVILCGAGLVALGLRARVDGARLPALLLLLLPLAFAGPGGAAAEELRVLPAVYPEGPLWQGDRLYFAEMRADRVTLSETSGESVFYIEDGCGPTAIAPYGEGFLVLCHLGKQVVAVDAAGRELRRWDRDAGGEPLKDPNDASADGQGGVYFSDPGRFARDSTPEGWVMYLGADGALARVAGPLWYPNGVHVADGALYVSEHLRRVVHRFPIEDEGRLGGPQVFADLAGQQASARYPEPYALSGPDGLELGPDGCLYVAVYGEGRLLRFSPRGALLGMLELPTRFLTNIAFGAPGVALAGSFDNRSGSSIGEVRLLSELPADLRAGACAAGE